ncbi:hypothetical protein LVD17_20520 [Fulvivirga ulvae]|uniref:hypothetical protein n=1 Tax=Fulvivirga ulvae TaxID=2904245 RepID=UPI001F224B38|nr:hypothetical protein [Fulvivirga ulvae]UII30681.1 hypothetical protein LVD17_20520 [Fulvivirga ulvae]
MKGINKKYDKLPYKISAYINKHFKEDFLFDVKEVRKEKHKVVYTIEVAKDGYIHMLQFNEEGRVLNQETEQAFPADDHDGRLS